MIDIFVYLVKVDARHLTYGCVCVFYVGVKFFK